MKKYNHIIRFTIVVYILLAIMTGVFLMQRQKEQNQYYKVEINRLYASYKGKSPKVSAGNAAYVQEVYFIEASVLNVTDTPDAMPKDNVSEPDALREVEKFFSHTEEKHTIIKPWYYEGKCTGYLCFVYTENENKLRNIFIYIEGILFLTEAFLFLFLMWIRKRVLVPFHKLQKLPDELAKGHLNAQVKEEHGKYFGDFMRGIGMLKDSLATSKKRELILLKEKKVMMLSLSHDIKTPLNTIKLYQKAMLEGMYDTKDKEEQALIQIGKRTEEIEQYVEHIISATKNDILEIPVHNTEFYLKDFIERFLQNYQEKCEMRMISLLVEKFENILLRGDLEKAIEVMENLFENAFKYGDGRRIEVSFATEEYCQLIRVYNTGQRVSDNDYNHLFESFYRGTNSEGQQGNGLGLYICKEIMNKMGGEIFADICEDGMAFTLVFTE